MPIKYIGKTTFCQGKTLWEIVGNLKNNGVGRIVYRNQFDRYPEKSWYKILKVDTAAQPEEFGPDNLRKVRVLVEKVWRGHKYEKPIEIFRTSYKADYKLVPKSEEKEFCKLVERDIKSLAIETVELPPLLKEILKESGVENPRLPINIRQGRDNRATIKGHQIEESNEIKINKYLGKPASPELYENVLQ